MRRRWLLYLFCGVVVTLILVEGVNVFIPLDRNSSRGVVFHIEKGEGSREIAYNLQKQGLIRFAPLFRMYVLSVGLSHNLQAGDYLLNPALSMTEMVKKFVQGDVAKDRITIIEGWSVEDIASYLGEKGLAEKEKVLNYKSLEGYLFPDTYEIKRGEDVELIIKKMTKNFEAKLDSQLREAIFRQGKTLPDVVTMASLLERELERFDDKRIAADVLWKRLTIGMPLQVDAAPITYAVPGLPQNPIANPGLESIKAAISPEKSPYWYYLSTPDGKTIFSRTLGEHNIAKARYLK